MSEKQCYDFPLDIENPANAHGIELRMVSPRSRVLDVGCHTGILGSILTEQKGCTVVGLDSDEAALAVARGRLSAAVQVDLERPDWSRSLAQTHEKFDVAIFGDVLEHTRDPHAILLEAKKLLKPQSGIVVSLPNVANWRVRLGLLAGRFDYRDSGILDRTHLRFFTIASARKLLEDAGFSVEELDLAGYRLPHTLIRTFPGLLAVQIVMRGKMR